MSHTLLYSRRAMRSILNKEEQTIVEEARVHAIEVLLQNAQQCGFSASTEKHANYFSIWARDHAIITLGAIASGYKDLIDTATKGLLLLWRAQSAVGQVPSYIDVEDKKREYGGFGAITSVDSNLWIAIASAALFKHTGDKKFLRKRQLGRYKKLYNLISSFDPNNDALIEVNIAGDWADVFTRSYHVLYDQVLYYEAIKALKYLHVQTCQSCFIKTPVSKNFQRKLSSQSALVKKRINQYMWFTKENIPQVKERYMIESKIPEKNYEYYQTHLRPFKHDWAHRIDPFGNSLSILAGIADKKRARKIIRYIFNNNINKPFPMKSLYPPIRQRNKDWEAIYAKYEKPYEYHNGGIWPMVGGFWIAALASSDMKTQAKKELLSLAKLLEKDKWQFHEYYNGKSGEARGRKEQAWSAAGFLIAYHSCFGKFKIFNF